MTQYDLTQLPQVREQLRKLIMKAECITGMGYSIVEKFEDMVRQEEREKKVEDEHTISCQDCGSINGLCNCDKQY